MRKEILTSVVARNIYMREVGERKGKKVQYVINKWINPKQNIRRGKVLAQLYSMVKIPHAETPEPSCGVKDRDRLKEEGD